MSKLLIKKFPEERKAIEKLGPLERYQLKYLFENEKKLLKIMKDNSIDIKLSYFFLSFGLINTLSREDIKNLNNNLINFKANKEKKSRLFIIVFGILNHWVNKKIKK